MAACQRCCSANCAQWGECRAGQPHTAQEILIPIQRIANGRNRQPRIVHLAKQFVDLTISGVHLEPRLRAQPKLDAVAPGLLNKVQPFFESVQYASPPAVPNLVDAKAGEVMRTTAARPMPDATSGLPIFTLFSPVG